MKIASKVFLVYLARHFSSSLISKNVKNEVVLQDNGHSEKACSPPFLATIYVMKWCYKTMDIARKFCSPLFLARTLKMKGATRQWT